MPSRRFQRKPPANLCAELAEEDGLDPRFDLKGPAGRVANRKSLQLCRQVERALGLALEGELLRDLTVASVVPAPDSSRLLATVVFHGLASVAVPDIVAALDHARTKLRQEVAAAIHRRKTPELSFRVVREEPRTK